MGHRRVVRGLALVVAAASLSSCTIGDSGRAQSVVDAPETTQQSSPQPPEINVDNGETGVEPAEPIKVTAAAGLDSVSMTNESGKEVEAEFNDDKSEWTTTEPLGYGRTYTVEARDTEGQRVVSSFTTLSPDATVHAYLGPLDGATVGVAQAVTIRFDTAIKDTKAVEDLIDVETSNGTDGAFFWLDPYEVRWRPKEYWEPGTEVSVKANIYGHEMGEGLYGAQDSETHFTIGDKVEAVVDNDDKMLRVYANDELVKEFPVSLGTDGTYDTPNGTYVVGDEHEKLTMDSRTYGLALDAGGYVTPVDYATQLSYSGIYVHSAPWAIGALGSYNQSHGCINASYDNAKWFQNYVKRGDPVVVKNTAGATLTPYDGLGYWNLDWEQRSGGSGEPLYP
ncbi:lipoprotein-anchoring transpeptidase ErfK/SrfK [Corynebacterium mucifaciens]|uniref:L,D-transpeptidase n=1 Tax=Corynebacterium ureicelerivorans TaxID=401472 RepID=UPI0023534150|nr:Ig-like domain-containing protein [Corynebacterium ureicelerivorans]MDN8626449.1 Ig-like domain-containing protein [Corynebacterium ureicelerivorans]